jgi:hypothetical protein
VIQKGLKAKRGRKKQQFATIMHLLQQGRPMLKFKVLKPWFSYFNVLMLP